MNLVKWIFFCVAVIVFCLIAKLFRYLVCNSRPVRRFRRKKIGYLDNSSFIRMKKMISSRCTEDTLSEFSNFIVHRYHGSKIIYPDDYNSKDPDRSDLKVVYTNKELADLKGIFLSVVVKAKYISIIKKEEFRRDLLALGVTGIEERPDYELRDGKLRMEKDLNQDEAKRKKVGNDGERKIRESLEPLKKKNYKVINGLKLVNKGKKIEIDHVVISNHGVFILETKAFGISEEGKDQACRLELLEDGRWLLYKKSKKNSYWYNRELNSPSDQLLRQQKFFNELFDDMIDSKMKIKYAMVLANSKIEVVEKTKPFFDMVKVDELEKYLSSRGFSMSEDRINFILMRIDNHRVN